MQDWFNIPKVINGPAKWLVLAALFVTGENWKPKCPSTGRQVNKLWYVVTMEYFSAIKGMC